MAISNFLTAALLTVTIGSSERGLNAMLAEKSFAAENPRFSITQLPNYSITKSSAQLRPADPIQEAESNLQKQQYDLAESQLQALVKSQPENPQVWFDLGFAESHLGKTADAITAYQKAVELSPKWFEASFNLGLVLSKAGNHAGAIAMLRTATQLKPTIGGDQALSNAWFSLAEELEETAPKESLAAYQKAAELNPTNTEPMLLGAGKVMEAQGDTTGAEKQYLAAAEKGSRGGVERLISLYLKQKRLPDAETWLRKYLAANPQNTAAQVQLGHLLAAEGKTQEAISALETMNNRSADPEIARELASLYLEAKQYDAAAEILQGLVQKDPNDAHLHSSLGSAFLHQHKYPEAEAELLQGLKINPRQDDAYWELAFAAQQNKHYELAIRVLDARAQRLPETASTYWIRAVSYDALGVFKPAAQNYKLFLAADAGKLPEEEFKARHRLKAIEH